MSFNRRSKGLDYPYEGTPAISLCVLPVLADGRPAYCVIKPQPNILSAGGRYGYTPRAN